MGNRKSVRTWLRQHILNQNGIGRETSLQICQRYRVGRCLLRQRAWPKSEFGTVDSVRDFRPGVGIIGVNEFEIQTRELAFFGGGSMWDFVYVMLQSLRLDPAPDLFQSSQRVRISLTSTKECKIPGVNITHLDEQLSLNICRRSMADHRVDQGDPSEVKAFRFLGMAYFLFDLGFDRKVPRHEIELRRNLCICGDGGINRGERGWQVVILRICLC